MTVLASKYKIRYFYPVIISLIVILVSVLNLFWSFVSKEKQIILHEEHHLEQSASGLQKTVNLLIKQNKFRQLPEAFSVISNQPNFQLSFIENPQGAVIFSTNPYFEAKPATVVFTDLDVVFENPPETGMHVFKNKLLFSSPLIFGNATGKLWIIHDISGQKSENLQSDFQTIFGSGIILFAVFFGISFLLYHSATRRLNFIRNNFLRFGMGERGLSFKVSGNDEISEIGDALHEMALTVENEEKQLIEKEKILTEMVGNLQGIAYKALDYEGRDITFISQGCVFLTGYTADEFIKNRSVTFETLIDREEYLKIIELIQIQIIKTGKYEVEYRIRNKDGSSRYVLDKGTGNLDASKLVSREGLIVDITNSKEIELKIRERDKIINQYIEIIDLHVLTSKTNLEGEITYVSEAFSKLTGYKPEELIGKKHRILRHPDMSDSFYEEMWKVLKSGMVWRGEIKNRKKTGETYWVDVCITPTTNELNEISGFTAVSEDISDRKKIEEIAITDELTGLYNRRFFNQTIPRELNRAIREKKKFVFLMADVDFFKKYNDNYGHQKGDEVLEKIGDVIRATFKRSGDFGFRLGGEEFGVFWHADDYEGVVRVVSMLRSGVEQLEIEHSYSEISDKITISIGVCLCVDNFTQEEVYKHADEALYEAKHSGRNQIKYRNI